MTDRWRLHQVQRARRNTPHGFRYSMIACWHRACAENARPGSHAQSDRVQRATRVGVKPRMAEYTRLVVVRPNRVSRSARERRRVHPLTVDIDVGLRREGRARGIA